MSYDFRFDGYHDPAPDILDNGLPKLSGELEVLHGIAVARWVDNDFGVVLAVTRLDLADLEQGDDEYDYEVQPYIRVDGEWQSTNASGGSSWPTPPFVRPAGLGQSAVVSGHQHGQGAGADYIRVVDGWAGEEVSTIEVVTDGRTVQATIESPIGAWVAGVQGSGPAQWIARNAGGVIVGTGEIDPNNPVLPDWVWRTLGEDNKVETKEV